MNNKINFLLFSILTLLGLFGLLHSVHSIQENDPWYRHSDMDQQHVLDALKFNSDRVPVWVIHPGWGSTILFAYYLKALKWLGMTPVAKITDLYNSTDPVIDLARLMYEVREFGLFIIIFLSLVMGIFVYKLTKSKMMFALGFSLSCLSFGFQFEATQYRTEPLSILFPLLGGIFVFMAKESNGEFSKQLYIIISGILVSFGIFTKLHAYPYLFLIPLILFFAKDKEVKLDFYENAILKKIKIASEQNRFFNKALPVISGFELALIFSLIASFLYFFLDLIVIFPEKPDTWPRHEFTPLSFFFIQFFGIILILNILFIKFKVKFLNKNIFKQLFNYICGLYFSSALVWLSLQPTYSAEKSRIFYKSMLYVVLTPWNSQKDYAQSTNTFNHTLREFLSFFQAYKSFYIYMLPLFVLFLVLGKSNWRMKLFSVLLLFLCSLYAFFLAMRMAYVYYYIYLDVFFVLIFSICLNELSKIIKWENISFNLVRAFIFIVAIFFYIPTYKEINLRLNANYRAHNKFLGGYGENGSQPYGPYDIRKIYNHEFWGDDYWKIMNNRYPDFNAFLGDFKNYANLKF